MVQPKIKWHVEMWVDAKRSYLISNRVSLWRYAKESVRCHEMAADIPNFAIRDRRIFIEPSQENFRKGWQYCKDRDLGIMKRQVPIQINEPDYPHLDHSITLASLLNVDSTFLYDYEDACNVAKLIQKCGEVARIRRQGTGQCIPAAIL